MKRTVRLALILLGLITVISSGSLLAQRGEERKHAPARKMLQQLNLTQEQKDQISKFRTENQKKNVDLKADMEKTRIAIKEEMTQKNPDEGKIIDLSKKVSSIQADMKAGAISTWFKTYRILDDKQKEVFKKAAPMLMDEAKGMKGRVKDRMKNRARFL